MRMHDRGVTITLRPTVTVVHVIFGQIVRAAMRANADYYDDETTTTVTTGYGWSAPSRPREERHWRPMPMPSAPEPSTTKLDRSAASEMGKI